VVPVPKKTSTREGEYEHWGGIVRSGSKDASSMCVVVDGRGDRVGDGLGSDDRY